MIKEIIRTWKRANVALTSWTPMGVPNGINQLLI
jgi:hypothetical protein